MITPIQEIFSVLRQYNPWWESGAVRDLPGRSAVQGRLRDVQRCAGGDGGRFHLHGDLGGQRIRPRRDGERDLQRHGSVTIANAT